MTIYRVEKLASNTQLLISTSYIIRNKLLIILFCHIAILCDGKQFYNEHISLRAWFWGSTDLSQPVHSKCSINDSCYCYYYLTAFTLHFLIIRSGENPYIPSWENGHHVVTWQIFFLLCREKAFLGSLCLGAQLGWIIF